MAEFKLKRGYDIPLAGAPAPDVVDAAAPTTIALKPTDFPGVKYRLLIQEGDTVKIGTPLMHSKSREDWLFSSPASGKVKSIVRGRRRVLEAVVIEPDAEQVAEDFGSHSADQLTSLSGDDALQLLLKAGMLNLFLERPYNYSANPDHEPRDIFISGFDTAPLAADTTKILEGNDEAFQAGLDVCVALSKGKVHLAAGPNAPSAIANAKRVEVHKFSGPHPAGCVGVQIHHIKPIANAHDIVWTTTVQGVIILGRLFLTGKIDPRTVVALAGSGATEAKHFRTVIGAEVSALTEGRLGEGKQRIISGNVLTGKKIAADSHIGFHDSLITVIPEAVSAEFCGWFLPGFSKLSWFRGFMSKLIPGRKLAQDTRMGGGHRAIVATGIYDAVLPMDIMPEFLIKSCLAQDIEEMEQLGIYEVTEDEFALCEYICPSKTEIQQIIREGLTLVEKEG